MIEWFINDFFRIIIFVFAASCLFMLYRSFRKTQVYMKNRVVEITKQAKQEAKDLRVLARKSLEVSRDLRKADYKQEKLNTEADNLKRRLTELESQINYVYVLEDRRAEGDQLYQIVVSHPSFIELNKRCDVKTNEDWARGRAYLVWGSNPKRAMSRVKAKFQEGKGYKHSEPVEVPMHERWQ